jgi:transcriptional regulator with XRE-family HTH domain
MMVPIMVEKKKKTTRKAAAKKSGTAAGRRKSTTAKAKSTKRKAASKTKTDRSQPLEQQFSSLLEGMSDLSSSAMKIVNKTRERTAWPKELAFGKKGKKPGKTPSAGQLRQMAAAGESLRDLREVAGLTLADMTKALNIKDKSFLEAVEDGKEALSMEMIMRLASLYARNDPVPFVINYIRTYRPKLWALLEEWGIDGIPVTLERERQFMNIYRRRDAARQLSNDGFEKVLAFTREAFEMALHFIAELEDIENEVNHEFDDIKTTKDRKNTKNKK